MSDTSTEIKSYTWPLIEKNVVTTKSKKRRFSWENLTKITRGTKLSKLKRKSHKSNLASSFNTPKPKSKPAFKTSTPLKQTNAKKTPSKVNSSGSETITSFGNSTSISQINKQNDAQLTTCGDRLGVPKTSLNDFKKLLLNATNKKILSSKPSAVEQLKLKHENLNVTPMKILDLSSSPKSFTNRRIFHQPQASNSSPYKKINLLSPRSRWKHNNFNKTPISSIPEDITEDDINDLKPTENTISKNDHFHSQNTPIYATPQKKLISLNDTISTPTTSNVEPIIANTESSPETGIIETNFSLKENIFLQTEENNFMKGEIKSFGSTIKPTPKSPPVITRKSNAKSSAAEATPSLETSF